MDHMALGSARCYRGLRTAQQGPEEFTVHRRQAATASHIGPPMPMRVTANFTSAQRRTPGLRSISPSRGPILLPPVVEVAEERLLLCRRLWRGADPGRSLDV